MTSNNSSSKTIVLTSNAPDPIGPYSQAVLKNGVLYASGQIAINPQNGELEMDNLEVETHRVMQNIQAVLKEVNMDFSHILKCSIFLSDMSNFGTVNSIYGSYFSAGNYPARETVEVSCLPKNVNVEISFIASAD